MRAATRSDETPRAIGPARSLRRAGPITASPAGPLARGSRLGRLIRATAAREAAAGQTLCELCAIAVAAEHRHLLDVESGRIRCACRPCSLLFDRPGAELRYRAIPDRVSHIEGFALDDRRWDELAVPVGLAYFVRRPDGPGVTGYYPAAMGAIESRLDLSAWDALVRENPVLERLEPAVEALLVHRARSRRLHLLVPIDACFRLVAILGTSWKGLGGGAEAWRQIDAFFDDLRRRARRVDRDGITQVTRSMNRS